MIRRFLSCAARLAPPALLLGACAPMVTHPPRVDPGVYVGITTGLVLPSDSALRLAMTPMTAPYVRYGDRLDNGWGLSGTVAASFGARHGFQGDLYAEVPSRTPGWVHGAGLVTAGNYTMPYVQVGRQDSTGSGWYTTHGYAWRGFQESTGNLFSTSDQVRPRHWTSTLTGRRERRGRAFEAYLSASVGSFDQREYEYFEDRTDTMVVNRAMWSVAIGLTTESSLSRLFRGYPGPRYPPRPPQPPVPPPVPLP